MFGILEKNDRKPTKEEADRYINELFDISTAAAEALRMYGPVGVNDFEFLIYLLKTLKENCNKLLDIKITGRK